MSERLQNVIVQLKSMELYLNDLIAKEASIVRLIEEGRLASNALRELDVKEEVSVLMPIGMGVYAQSTINPSVKFIVNVGAGCSIEKKREDALAFIDNRLRELEAALNSIITQKREIEARMEEMRREANDLIMKMQKQ